MSRKQMIMAGIGAVLVIGGCQRTPLVFNAAQKSVGLVIVLPGIDGRAAESERICQTIRDSGAGLAVELVDWTSPLGPLVNQLAMDRNKAEARKLAGRIAEYHREFAGRPVFLIGHSGGTAIAVWAVEALPKGERVDGVVLLASSLSAGYDLQPALARARRWIVAFNSERDAGLLKVGTETVGTMDRKHEPAAGYRGFVVPAGPAGKSDYLKLHQVAWRPNMAQTGHNGSHFGCTASGFIAASVVPLIRGRAWDEPTITSVAAVRPMAAGKP